MKMTYNATDKPYFPSLNRLRSLKLHIICIESPVTPTRNLENHPLKVKFLLLLKRNNGKKFKQSLAMSSLINLSVAGVSNFNCGSD